MPDKTDQPGLGKVIYSVDQDEKPEDSEKKPDRSETASVEEADRESFPASDPPGFSGAKEASAT